MLEKHANSSDSLIFRNTLKRTALILQNGKAVGTGVFVRLRNEVVYCLTAKHVLFPEALSPRVKFEVEYGFDLDNPLNKRERIRVPVFMVICDRKKDLVLLRMDRDLSGHTKIFQHTDIVSQKSKLEKCIDGEGYFAGFPAQGMNLQDNKGLGMIHKFKSLKAIDLEESLLGLTIKYPNGSSDFTTVELPEDIKRIGGCSGGAVVNGYGKLIAINRAELVKANAAVGLLFIGFLNSIVSCPPNPKGPEDTYSSSILGKAINSSLGAEIGPFRVTYKVLNTNSKGITQTLIEALRTDNLVVHINLRSYESAEPNSDLHLDNLLLEVRGILFSSLLNGSEVSLFRE